MQGSPSTEAPAATAPDPASPESPNPAANAPVPDSTADTAPAATPAPDASNATKDLSALSSEELFALLRETDSSPEATDEQAGDTQETAETTDDTPAAEPEQGETPAEEEPAEEHVPERLRMKGLPVKDRALLAAAVDLQKQNPKLTLAQALVKAGLQVEQDQQDEEDSEDDEPPAPPDPLTVAREQVDALLAQIKEAKSNLDEDAEMKLLAELQVANRRLGRLEGQHEAAAQTAETIFTDKQAKAFAAVEAVSPEWNDRSSQLRQIADARFEQLRKSAPGVFNDPEWVAEVFAYAHRKAHPGQPVPYVALGDQSKETAAQAPSNLRPQSTKPLVTKQPVRAGIPAAMAPASGRSGSTTNAEAIAQAALKSGNPKDLLAALTAFDRGG